MLFKEAKINAIMAKLKDDELPAPTEKEFNFLEKHNPSIAILRDIEIKQAQTKEWYKRAAEPPNFLGKENQAKKEQVEL